MKQIKEAEEKQHLEIVSSDNGHYEIVFGGYPDKVVNPELYDIFNKVNPISEELRKLSGDLLGSYSSFVGSPASKGELQFDMWEYQHLQDISGLN